MKLLGDYNDVIASYVEEDYEDAKRHAQRIKGVVVCAEYEFSDSYLVDDFREKEDS